MTNKLPLIYFYIPKERWPTDKIPEDPSQYGQFQRSKHTNFGGDYSWTLQTYLHLKANGFPCELTATLPSQGIVLSHRYLLPSNLQPKPELLLVCMQSDRGRHPYAQLHVVQNPRQEIPKRPFTLWESYFISHWPQAGLIPRDPKRGDRFENVAYFGVPLNLVPELQQPAWQEQLKALGLNWHVVTTSSRWHDYSDVDVVLAARAFGRPNSYAWKPATKLYNAWHAGVPAIFSGESSLLAERQSELDYMEVTSLNDVVSALKRLRDDKELRHAIVKNGQVRAEETTPARLVTRWCNFLTDIAAPTYSRWCERSDVERRIFLKSRQLAYKPYRVQRRLRLVAANGRKRGMFEE